MNRINAIHQIEMTSECNLRCKYCAHPKMPRAKIHMTAEVYKQALAWAKYYDFGELNLAGIGESTMHPEFVKNCFLAREAIGEKRDLILATNGLLVTDELAKEIAATRIRVWVSAHRPEKAGPAVEALKRAGILAGISVDPTFSSVDWAGQVDWHVSTPMKGSPCPWVPTGSVFVLSDGRIARCCFDATGDDVLGDVFQDVTTLRTSAYALCKECHHVVN